MACLFFIDYTELAMSTVTQRQSIAYTGTLSQLYYYLSQLSGDIENADQSDKKGLKIFKAVTLLYEPGMVTLEVGLVECLCYIGRLLAGYLSQQSTHTHTHTL